LVISEQQVVIIPAMRRERALLVGIGLVLTAAFALAATAGTYVGAITGSDPSHTNFSNFAAGGPSVCGPSPAYPGTITDSSAYHYDTYAEVNSTGSPVCASITVQANAQAGSLGVASYAYFGSFDPNNLAANYAGGANSQIPGGGQATYHVTVPAGQTLVAEVEEYVAGTGASYTLTIDMGPTAVLLRSASAKRTSRGVVVRWRTAQEADIVGFRVERSTAGRTMRVGPRVIEGLGGVAGHGYVLLDRTAPRGRVVYRLEAVTRDGSAHFVAAVVARV
jgi:hypothetical protein